MENPPNIIGESYLKLVDYLNKLGEQPADMAFTAYYNFDMQNMDVEMGFLVSKPLPG
jgi:hypothetical protein